MHPSFAPHLSKTQLLNVGWISFSNKGHPRSHILSFIVKCIGIVRNWPLLGERILKWHRHALLLWRVNEDFKTRLLIELTFYNYESNLEVIFSLFTKRSCSFPLCLRIYWIKYHRLFWICIFLCANRNLTQGLTLIRPSIFSFVYRKCEQKSHCLCILTWSYIFKSKLDQHLNWVSVSVKLLFQSTCSEFLNIIISYFNVKKCPDKLTIFLRLKIINNFVTVL